MGRVANLLRSLGRGLRAFSVGRWLHAHPGQILAISRGEKGWCAAVGTPYGTFLTGTPYGTFLWGDCFSTAHRGEVYNSRWEPSAPYQYEALRWGVGKMVELATQRARDLSFWEAPGLLYEGFWGKGYLVLYWKCGELDFLEVWTPGDFFRLQKEKDPDSWWRLYEALLRNSYSMEGFLKEPYMTYEELLPLLPARVSGQPR